MRSLLGYDLSFCAVASNETALINYHIKIIQIFLLVI